jgi:hypothetical protein
MGLATGLGSVASARCPLVRMEDFVSCSTLGAKIVLIEVKANLMPF